MCRTDVAVGKVYVFCDDIVLLSAVWLLKCFLLCNIISVYCTMALVSTQRLTEMSTRNLAGVKRRPARKIDNLTAVCEPIF
jgi:hypothetical protein